MQGLMSTLAFMGIDPAPLNRVLRVEPIDPETALVAAIRAFELNPSCQPRSQLPIEHIRFWAAWHRLKRGHYDHETWEWWENRFGIYRHPKRVMNRACYWDGRPLGGRTIWLDYDEAGLGDILQFGRCAAVAKAAGGRVVIPLEPRLHCLLPLLKLCSAIDEVILIGKREMHYIPSNDVGMPILSFPLILGVTQSTIPNCQWLPDPPPEYRERARTRIGGAGFRIGLSWGTGEDNSRDVPLAAFTDLAAIPGVSLFSLQRGKQVSEMKDIGFNIANGLEDGTHILDTAAAMCELDLIISADTMTCHLAGSLGKPVYTLLPNPACWRWMVGRSDTPWYPTMTLFRQTVAGDWSTPVAEVVAAVRSQLFRDEPKGVPAA
jgi:hypothetical protein